MPRMAEPNPGKNGWIAWRPLGQANATRVACCECGLVHDWEAVVRRGRVWVRIRRNNRSTANVRRGMKHGGSLA